MELPNWIPTHVPSSTKVSFPEQTFSLLPTIIKACRISPPVVGAANSKNPNKAMLDVTYDPAVNSGEEFEHAKPAQADVSPQPVPWI